MRLLLDTHVVIWWFEGNTDELSDDARDMLCNEIEVCVSPVSVWEVTIKQSMGRLKAPRDLAETIRDSDFNELPLRHDHTLVAGRLPLIHRDPFDRLLVAQAQCDDLTLVTKDDTIARYDVAVLRP